MPNQKKDLLASHHSNLKSGVAVFAQNMFTMPEPFILAQDNDPDLERVQEELNELISRIKEVHAPHARGIYCKPRTVAPRFTPYFENLRTPCSLYCEWDNLQCKQIEPANKVIQKLLNYQESMGKKTQSADQEAHKLIAGWERLAKELRIAMHMQDRYDKIDLDLKEKDFNQNELEDYDNEDNKKVEEHYRSYITAKVDLDQHMYSHLVDTLWEPEKVLRLRVQLREFQQKRPERWGDVQKNMESDLILKLKDVDVAEEIIKWVNRWMPTMDQK
jgi:hypothetical protein